MSKILIIDSSSLIISNYLATVPKEYENATTIEEKDKYRNFIRHTTNKNGNVIYTNAISLSLNFLLNQINSNKFDAICFCFDENKKNLERRELYSEYKANRTKSDFVLIDQIKLFHSILKEIGMPCFSFEKYEADDIAGSLAQKFKKDKSNTIILYTKDKDYLQLVDNNVFLCTKTSETKFNRLNKIFFSYRNFINQKNVYTYNPINVTKIFGLKPSQIVDFKAISGDKSDNIPGIKGIGDKTVIPLLQKYENLENIYKEIETTDNNILKNNWKKELSIHKNPIKQFKEQKDIAFLSKTLATIKTDIDIKENLEDLKINLNKSTLQKIISNYELFELEKFLDI